MISRVSENGTSRVLTGYNSAINQQTGTTYTLTVDDLGKLVELNNGSAITLTVPTDANANFTIGDRVDLVQTGAGQVTVVGASGVTVNATPGLKLSTQWSAATLIKRSANAWLLVGNLTA